MSIENKKTLEIYRNKAHVYLATGVGHDRLNPIKAKKKRENLEEFIKISFSSLSQHAKIFEIGSADGVNAKFIENLGFNVTAKIFCCFCLESFCAFYA